MTCPCCCGPCAKTSVTQMIVDVSLSPFSGGCDNRGPYGFDNCNRLDGTYVIDLADTNGCSSGKQFRSYQLETAHEVLLGLSFAPDAGIASATLSASFLSSNSVSTVVYRTTKNVQKSFYPVGVPRSPNEREYDNYESAGELSTAAKKCLVVRTQSFSGNEQPSGCYSDPQNWNFESEVTFTSGYTRYDVDGEVGAAMSAMRKGYDCSSSMCASPGTWNPFYEIFNYQWVGSWQPCSFLPACSARCDIKGSTLNIRFQ